MRTRDAIRFIVFAALTISIGCGGQESDQTRAPAKPPASEKVAVTAPALNASPKTPDFVVEAQNSIRFSSTNIVNGGDVGARGTGSGPFLSGGVAIDVGSTNNFQTTRNLIADSIRLGTNATVGDLQTNRFVDATGTHHGTVTALVALPALPLVTLAAPGTSNLTVANGATVSASPGKFNTVSVGNTGKLRLAAGVYEMSALTLGTTSRIEALGAVQLRIAGRLSAGDTLFIGPASGVTLTAKDIRIEVSGINGSNGALTATPKAATIGNTAQIRALVLVPNGTLQFGSTLQATGAFFARDVDVGTTAQITFQNGFACSTAASCNDNNPCTVDACNSGTCSNTLAGAGTACPDGNACNGNETCDAAGTCKPGTPVQCTALDQCHTAGTCNAATGACTNPNKADATACNDGSACTGTDRCTAGACVGSNPVVCSAADQCHAAGMCNPATGTCSNPPLANGTACNDGSACTTGDTCTAGSCVGGSPLVCTASDQCHAAGTCNPSTGSCSNPLRPNGTACDDGNPNTVTDVCTAGACAGVNRCAGVTCVASDQCHTAGTCDPATGACSNPQRPNGTMCNDGSLCTTADTCTAGICVGASAIGCSASDQCHAVGSCNPASGTCSNPLLPNGTACDDANPGTIGDVCTSGTCAGHDRCAGVTCVASDPCHAAGTCDSTTGLCSNPPRPDGAACDDGDRCTQIDTCGAGVCIGANPINCFATDACHTPGACDPASGTCANPALANGTVCEDGNPHTVGDVCTGGTCAGVDHCVGVTCTASDACHVAGSCDHATGLCSNPPIIDGIVCDDGDACTQSDSCIGGTCVGANPVSCPAIDVCHAPGICDSIAGTCINPNAPEGTPCSDGNGCTQTDVCQAGLCTGTNPVSCGAVDDCHLAGTCDTSSGTCSNPIKPDCQVAIHITTPASLITVGAFPIQVTGTVSQPDAAITLNGVAVQNVGGTFSGAVTLDEGHNTVVARAVKGNQEATDSIAVSLDMTPPYVTVESHTDGQIVYTSTVTVTGLINDIVRGTLEQAQALVTVNGVAATISNRSYAAKDVPLTPGDNLITVTGTDQVGNVGTTHLMLRYNVLQGRRIQVFSGQDQTAHIENVLPNPLVVRVLDDALQPVPNTPVVFRVVQDSGLVGIGSADAGRAVVVETNAQGMASTRFKLGSRSGTSNQKVRAKVVGYDDEALFDASALANVGDRIGVNSGNNQRGSVGQTLPDPFVVVVTDDGGNVVQGARVRFDVTLGGGTLTGGLDSYETLTDSDGRATAEYTLGTLLGIDAQLVTAKLVDAQGPDPVSAGFKATGFIPGNPGQTTISGIVLDNQDNPVPGVTVRVEGTTRQAVADAQGQFLITEAPVGSLHLMADGSTATVPGEYPSLGYDIVTVAGVDNPLSAPIYMVKLDTTTAVNAGPTDVAIELPGYPGFKLEIAKGAVTFPDGAKAGQVSVTVVNSSAVPMVPPNGMQPQFIISIQPAGMRIDPPARMTIPNIDGFAPGTQTEMYSFDHDLEEFVPIGLGTVSEDGSVIQSNPGVGVIKAGWHATTKPERHGCTCSCPVCQACNAECACVASDGDPGPLAAQDVRGDCKSPACQGGGVVQNNDDNDVPAAVPGDCSKTVCRSGHPATESDPTDLPANVEHDCKAPACNNGSAAVRFDDRDKGEDSCCYQGEVLAKQGQTVDAIGQGTLESKCPGRTQNSRLHVIDGCSGPAQNNPMNNNPYFPCGLLNQAPVDFGDDHRTDDNPTGEIQNPGAAGHTACNLHDLCYQTCAPGGADLATVREHCDDGMKANMDSTCNAAFPATCPARYNSVECQCFFEQRSDCLGYSSLYWVGLRAGGFDAFQNRQEQYCQCCE